METCQVCSQTYKKSLKYQHEKNVKHLEKLGKYYCKNVINI